MHIKETNWVHKKNTLLSYLKKNKRKTIYHLTREWVEKDEFTKKDIIYLILRYHKIFKSVSVLRTFKGKRKAMPGVGLV